MNSFYHAVVFECMKEFVSLYNRIVVESPKKAKEMIENVRKQIQKRKKDLEETNELPESIRGEGGFGSTGK